MKPLIPLHRYWSGVLVWLVLLGGCTKREDPGTVPDKPIVPCFSSLLPGGSNQQQDYIVTYRQQTSFLKKDLSPWQAASKCLQRNHIKASVLDVLDRGMVCRMSVEAAQQLQKDPEVAWVEADRQVQLITCLNLVSGGTMDWGVKRVGYADGSTTTAWIIDTGIDLEHQDLNIDKIRSRSFVDGEPSPQDKSGHGTHVAGIIGAKNNGFGTVGVASGATLVALKVLNQTGSGRVSAVVRALDYIGQHAQPGEVVNMSLVSDTIFQSLDQAVRRLADRGVLFAVASGNERRNASQLSPCRVQHPNVFVTAAMDSTDSWADFSNFGAGVVQIAAPGVSIQSTWLGNGYAQMSGTSMAAPHVAGLLLLDGKHFQLRGTVRLAPDGVNYPIPHKR